VSYRSLTLFRDALLDALAAIAREYQRITVDKA